MELSKKELENIIARQAKRVAKESDGRMEKKFKKWSRESDKRMERYIGGLKEDFDSKIDTVMEYVKDIPALKEDMGVLKQDVNVLKEDVNVLKQDVAEMKPVLDATFEKVGEIAVDVEVIKESAKNHEVRLQRLEVK